MIIEIYEVGELQLVLARLAQHVEFRKWSDSGGGIDTACHLRRLTLVYQIPTGLACYYIYAGTLTVAGASLILEMVRSGRDPELRISRDFEGKFWDGLEGSFII